MPPRFYAPGLSGIGQAVLLPDDEAIHLTRVLRLDVGVSVSVFDGRGLECLARVEAADGSRVVVRPYERISTGVEPSVALRVAHALLKGRKFDDVVRDVTMVGAVSIQPLVTERTETRPRDLGRWRRIAVASAKQCQRAVLPTIGAPQPADELFASDDAPVRLLLVEPGAEADAGQALRGLEQRPRPSRATLAVGPEGGWSEQEVAAARAAGFIPVTLGRRTLRADAVVVCAVSVLQYIWGDL